jgi:hypothetical protein
MVAFQNVHFSATRGTGSSDGSRHPNDFRGRAMSNMQNTILVGTGVVAALPLIPLGHFLAFGWPARKQQIVCRFSDETVKLYRDTFFPKSQMETAEAFAKDYDERYGRRLFFFPILLFAGTLLFLAYHSVGWIFSHDWLTVADNSAKVAISALAGAYVWVTYDLISRVRQNDLVTSDVNRATLRLLLSLPFGFAIAAFAGAISGGPTLTQAALAFFVGAFPTDTVLKFMRRTGAASLKLDAETGGDDVQQLKSIDGVIVPIAERFIDEGVKTNLQLAYSDPIALTIKTGMDFSFILDCCGQALVRMYFDNEQMKSLRKLGLRTTIEVKSLNDLLAEYDTAVRDAQRAGTPAPAATPDQVAAQAQLTALAAALTLDENSTRFMLDQIAGDPYSLFAWDIWSS